MPAIGTEAIEDFRVPEFERDGREQVVGADFAEQRKSGRRLRERVGASGCGRKGGVHAARMPIRPCDRERKQFVAKLSLLPRGCSGNDAQSCPSKASFPSRFRNSSASSSVQNSDPTGLAGFFSGGEIWVGRVPARLDVMGGIADYSGANVCEAVLGRGMLMALQPRTDRTLRIRTLQQGRRSLPVETRIPLDYFTSGEGLTGYAEIRDLCQSNPLVNWVAYIGGSIFTMLKEESVSLPYGFSLLLLSAVPMNVGIGSSAAVEIGTLSCLNAYLGLDLSAERLARLGQMAENHVVGAPCGIMDQTAITSGRQGRLTHILCRPGKVLGDVPIPRGTGFVGINSMVRHSVAGNPYGDTRIGAFMGRRMINATRARTALRRSTTSPNSAFRNFAPNTRPRCRRRFSLGIRRRAPHAR